jgi:hypothetical protein
MPMSPLDRLPGTWNLTMHHADIAEPVIGRQQYEWVLDGAFLQLRLAYERPDFPDALALFSPQRYHYFDVRGVVRDFDVTLSDDGWSTINITDDELSQRTTAQLTDDDTIEVTGQRSTDAGTTWEPDFTMTLTRATP